MQANLTDSKGKHWDHELAKLERDLNSAESKMTEKTPFEMLYGYVSRFDDRLSRSPTVNTENFKPPNQVRHAALDHIEKEKLKAEKRYDTSRYNNVKYNVGDKVYMKLNKSSLGKSTKLQPRFKSPLIIVRILPSDTYKV